MKTISIILCVILLCVGIMLASGIEANPIQAVYSLGCMVGAYVCSCLAERKPERKSMPREKRVYKVYNYQTGNMDVRVA